MVKYTVYQSPSLTCARGRLVTGIPVWGAPVIGAVVGGVVPPSPRWNPPNRMLPAATRKTMTSPMRIVHGFMPMEADWEENFRLLMCATGRLLGLAFAQRRDFLGGGLGAGAIAAFACALNVRRAPLAPAVASCAE